VTLTITEKDFQRQVLDLAAIYRWASWHPFLSKWSARGFPDLVLVRPPRVVFAELKRHRARTTEAQREWLDLLEACPGVETYLWYPADFDEIVRVLH
jgi:hypothetical protein